MRIRFFAALVILCFIQVAVLDSVKLFGVKPDLLLLGAVAAAMVFKMERALAFAALAGLLKDCFTADTFGTNTLLFPLWAFLIIRLLRSISLETGLRLALLVLVTAVSQNLAVRMIKAFLGRGVPLGSTLRVLLFGSLYTAAVAYPAFELLKKRVRLRI
ncbi:rod shape-determining protein MreD [Candidatus Omnitrophota bacterium]